MQFTEWKKRERDDVPTMVLVELVNVVSYKDWTKRTRKQMKRLNWKLLVVSTERLLLDKSKNIEAELPLKPHRESRSQPRRITPDEVEPTDVKPRLCCMMDELVRGIEEREARVQDSSWTWMGPRYLVEEERRDQLQVHCHKRPCRSFISYSIYIFSYSSCIIIHHLLR
jgi:hypothetical protein